MCIRDSFPSLPLPSLPPPIPPPSTYLPIYLPTSTYPSTYLPIYLSIYLPSPQSTNLPIYLPPFHLPPLPALPPARPRAGVPTPASHTLPKAFYLPSPRPKPSQIQAALFFLFFLFYANQAGLEPVTSLFAN